jgi:hypothetical protein
VAAAVGSENFSDAAGSGDYAKVVTTPRTIVAFIEDKQTSALSHTDLAVKAYVRRLRRQ